ncbi:MAG: S26 family signal peptidase [Thiothrix sp.]|uniref:S26 family signal peptidase n=1 Tax=Thiothrix sp. TaxID=1032 RepID=UPI0026141AD6|nr:S26 family signal peptidase [Thiothrix sp.]MDD5394861.1 S26 family signal peptidase [Thiothrix sp.]
MNRKAVLARFARLVALAGSIAALLWWGSWQLSPYIRIGINASDSLPGWVYVAYPGDKAHLQVGDTIGFYPAPNRFYPPSFLFIKLVAGIAGDRLTWGKDYPAGTTFYINGQEFGRAKPQARTGEPLQHTPAGTVPDGAVFVWTPHPDSFDSRYADMGLIPNSQVVGRAQRLF